MEEIKNGIISEEALDEIAGGLNISKDKVVSVFKEVGIGVGTAAGVLAALGAAGAIGYKAYTHNFPFYPK